MRRGRCRFPRSRDRIVQAAAKIVLEAGFLLRAPRAAPSGLAADAWEWMRQFVEANATSHEVRDRLGLGTGSGRVKVLFLLRQQPMTLAQLAEAHGVDRPYATLIVDKLEHLGFVERRPHPSDRRSKVVSLTPAGREA